MSANEAKVGTEFLHVEKMAPTEILCILLKVYGDQIVDVDRVSWDCHISVVATVTVDHLCWCIFLQAQHASS